MAEVFRTLTPLGNQKFQEATVERTGAADEGKIIAAGEHGYLDPSWLSPEILGDLGGIKLPAKGALTVGMLVNVFKDPDVADAEADTYKGYRVRAATAGSSVEGSETPYAAADGFVEKAVADGELATISTSGVCPQTPTGTGAAMRVFLGMAGAATITFSPNWAVLQEVGNKLASGFSFRKGEAVEL